MATRRRRKATVLGQPLDTAVEAVLLPMDVSKHSSGVSLWIPEFEYAEDDEEEGPRTFLGTYEIVEFGVVKERDQKSREQFVHSAVQAADELEVPLIIPIEIWAPGGKRMTHAVRMALGEGWGLWRAELLHHNIPDRNVLGAIPESWRSRVFGRGPRRSREQWKEYACDWVVENGIVPFRVGDDIAESLCLGKWGAYAPEVHEIARLEAKRLRRKDVEGYGDYAEE